jgi:hypothetical protein
MIKYALKCSNGHQFDSWFKDSQAFDTLQASGHLACSICADTDVTKAIMAPRVAASDRAAQDHGPLSAPSSPAEVALRELRAHVEANSENVGKNFASEARRIHDGDAPTRAIFGEAKLEEAKSLIEDGIPVAPLPWKSDKTH